LERANQSLSSNIASNQLKIENLETELAAKEAEILRLRHCSSTSSEKAKIGFMIADAMCEHFNPRFCDSELTRLIKEINHQHISLTETIFLRSSNGPIPPTRAALFQRCP
jgi:hypothetical protein